MKINEIIEEGWKEKAAALAAATTLGLGGAAYDYAKDPANGPEVIKRLVNLGKSKNSRPNVQGITQKITNLTAPTAPFAKPSHSTNLDPEKSHTGLNLQLPKVATFFLNYAKKMGIKGDELAQLMAQASHETHDFRTLKEYGDNKYFKKYDIRFNPKKAKELGNTNPGDGAEYRGRAFLQITGKHNAAEAQRALGYPLVDQPELMEDPEIAAEVSLWYWKTKVKPAITDFSDTRRVTKIINPGLLGLDKREENFQKFRQELN